MKTKKSEQKICQHCGYRFFVRVASGLPRKCSLCQRRYPLGEPTDLFFPVNEQRKPSAKELEEARLNALDDQAIEARIDSEREVED